MQTLVLGRASEKNDGLRGSAAAFVCQRTCCGAALHSHSLENCGNAQLSQWISVAFLSIRRLCIVSFSAKFLGVQDFSHTFSVASVVIITRGLRRLLCVWGAAGACEEKPRRYSFHEIKPFLRLNLKPARLHFAAAALAAKLWRTLLTKANRKLNTAIAALCS
jgi:hypothetical protein